MARKESAKKHAAKQGVASSPRRSARAMEFIHKPTCTTCRKAKAYLESRGVELHFRNLDKERLSAAELDKLIGSRDHRDFLNPRNELYRAKKMKQNPPGREEAIRLMAENPNLIRRPVVLAGGRVVLGFDPEEYKSL